MNIKHKKLSPQKIQDKDTGRNYRVNHRILILGGLVFLSFILRILVSNSKVLYPDTCLYLSFAKSILRGKFSTELNGGVEQILSPLYPLLTALFSPFAGNIEIAAILVSAVAGTLLVLPVFYITEIVYNKTAAWISVALIIFSPILIHWSGAMLTESLFIALFISGIALGWHALTSRRDILFFITGILAGLSYMTRVIGMVFIPVYAIWIIFYSIRNYKTGYRKVFVLLSLFLIGFLLVTGPYLVHLRSVYGHWTLSAYYGSIEKMIKNEGADTVAGWEEPDKRKVDGGFLSTLSKKVAMNGLNYSTTLMRILNFTIIFIILGLITGRKIIYILSFVSIYFLALLFLPLSPIFSERARYLSPILPLLLVILSGGIMVIHGWVKWKVAKKATIAVGMCIFVLSLIPQFDPKLEIFPPSFRLFWRERVSVNHRENIGKWMKENLPQPIRVMSRKPIIPYYADGIFFLTPPTYEGVIRRANIKKVDYIVIDRSVDYYLRPKLRFLFDPNKAPEDLEFLVGLQHHVTKELILGVYKIKRSGSAQ